MPVVSSMSTETTMGSGLNGGACDTAHLVVTEVLAMAMRLNICGYVIYADVRTAFASLHRNIAMMTDDDGDDVWLAHLVHCGYTPEQASSIIALACDLVKWTQHGGTEHTLAMIKEAHTNTWFSVEGLRECVVYFQGVGAGTPLADAIFCIGASCCMGLIEHRLNAAGLQNYLDATGADEFWAADVAKSLDDQQRVNATHAVYVDDGAFPGMSHISSVVDRIAASMTIIVNTLSDFMFEANLAAGKTEVSLRLVGPNVAGVKQQLIDADMKISFKSHHGIQQVRVVDKYAHLGQSTTATCTRKQEIISRKRSCVASLGPIASKCFDIPDVDIDHKVNIAQAHLFSRMYFGAGTWCTLTKHEEALHTSAAMHVWRRTTGTTYQHRANSCLAPLSDAQVIEKYKLMIPSTMVRLLRLNLFIRIASCENAVLKAVVFAARSSTKSWLATVYDDFAWLKAVCNEAQSKILDGIDTLPELVPAIRHAPLVWKKAMKTLCSHPAANIATDDSDEPSVTLGQLFGCDTCTYVCTSPQQLALHAFKAHGVVRTARKFLDASNTCPACHRRYPTRTQALRHMSGATKCASYSTVCEEAQQTEVERLDAAETERLQKVAASGVADCCALRSLCTLAGPLLECFEQCYKGRPRTALVEPKYEVCPAEFFQACGDQCVLCRGIQRPRANSSEQGIT